MTPIYLNSKDEEIVIADMELPHLLFSLAANARVIGKGEEEVMVIKRKQAEVKHMHADVLRRFSEARGDNQEEL